MLANFLDLTYSHKRKVAEKNFQTFICAVINLNCIATEDTKLSRTAVKPLSE